MVFVETATENASADADGTFLLNSLPCIPHLLHVGLRGTS